MPWSVHQILEYNSGFRSVKDYAEIYYGNPKTKILAYSNNHQFRFDITVFVDIIISDYVLRENVQQEESLKKKVKVLKKTIYNEEEKAQLCQYKSELQAVRRKYTKAEQKFYLFDAMLPSGSLRKSYESLRENPNWYLREKLVEDCAKRRERCGRNCGFCENRRSSTDRHNGIGHCTPPCGCCSLERGFAYTEDEKQQNIEQIREKLEDDNLAYMVRMTDAYFLPSKEKKVPVKEHTSL